MTEFQKFVSDSTLNETEGFQRIISQLTDMMDRWGFQDHYFRQEGRSSDSVSALSKQSKNVRLYCCRWGERTLVLGCGHLKNVQKVQDDPTLYRHMQTMMYIDKRLKDRIIEKAVRLREDGELIGELYFSAE